ncbi:MAG: oligosaccharide flippase family protein [Clostridiales bacterium]|nr:oligosaccharide flippase family protein [Clostridiales bacterium]
MINWITKIFSFKYAHKIKDRFSISPLTRRFSSGIFWTMIGNTVARVLSGIGTILLARILGPRGLGELGIVESTVAMFAVYGAFRLGNTAVRYVARYRVQDPEKASRVLKLALSTSLILCSIMGITIALLSKYIAIHSLKNADIAGSIAIGGALLFFLTYGNITQQALAGFEDFRSIARVNFWRGILTLLGPLPLAYFLGVHGALWGLVLSSAVLLPVISHYLHVNSVKAGFINRTSISSAIKELPVLWQYSLPGFFVLAVMTLTIWISNVILARQLNGFAELGIFQGAHAWERLITFIPGSMARVMLPILSETHGRRGDDEFKKAVSLQLEAVCMFTVPLAIAMIGFTRPLAGIFGRKFIGMEQVLPFLAVSAVLFSVNEAIRVIYEGMSRQWTSFVMYVSWGGALITACYVLVPSMGAEGLALSYLIANTILFTFQSTYVNRVLVLGVMKKTRGHFIQAVCLLGFCFLIRYFLPSGPATFAYIFLLTCSLLPILSKLRAESGQLFH